jgi:hypothetical protein
MHFNVGYACSRGGVMSGPYTYKDVWRKNDTKAKADAIAAWKAESVLPPGVDPETRAKELAVLAYEGDRLVAIATATIRYLENVRQNMAMFRIFIVADKRREGIAVPLTAELFNAMESYSRQNPELRIGGIGAFIVTRGFLDNPVTNNKLLLIGYSEQNHPIIVKWFDHFDIDEDAAIARVPGKSSGGRNE